MSNVARNCLDGLINNKPFMPWAGPEQQAIALMELTASGWDRRSGV